MEREYDDISDQLETVIRNAEETWPQHMRKALPALKRATGRILGESLTLEKLPESDRADASTPPTSTFPSRLDTSGAGRQTAAKPRFPARFRPFSPRTDGPHPEIVRRGGPHSTRASSSCWCLGALEIGPDPNHLKTAHSGPISAFGDVATQVDGAPVTP